MTLDGANWRQEEMPSHCYKVSNYSVLSTIIMRQGDLSTHMLGTFLLSIYELYIAEVLPKDGWSPSALGL